MSDRQYLANAIRALSWTQFKKPSRDTPARQWARQIAEVLWRDYLKHNPNNPDLIATALCCRTVMALC